MRARFARTIEARGYSLFGGIVQTIGVSMHNLDMVKLGVAKYQRAVEILPESRNTRRLLEDKEAVFRHWEAEPPAPAPMARRAPPGG